MLLNCRRNLWPCNRYDWIPCDYSFRSIKSWVRRGLNEILKGRRSANFSLAFARFSASCRWLDVSQTFNYLKPFSNLLKLVTAWKVSFCRWLSDEILFMSESFVVVPCHSQEFFHHNFPTTKANYCLLIFRNEFSSLSTLNLLFVMVAASFLLPSSLVLAHLSQLLCIWFVI